MNCIMKSISPPIDDLPLKTSISYNSTINQSSEINKNDPIFKLLNKYDDIEKIQKINENQLTQFLYFNREKIKKILYEEDENIHFNYNINNNILSFYFYLILLIKDQNEILNYTYDIKYIKEMDDGQENNEKIFNKLIMSKIIIELTNNYKEINDCYGDKNEEELNKIIEKNETIIKNYIECFESDLPINKFLQQKIDEIYIKIINKLILDTKNEYNDYNDKITILTEQLDIENINLNENMWNEISNTLNSKELYDDFLIKKKEDLYNEKKINFYYILLKYILKNPIYIYHNQFLIQTRKNIFKIIKIKKSLYFSEDIEKEKRAKYVIEIFICSNKFFKKKTKKSRFTAILNDRFNLCQQKSSERIISEKDEDYNNNSSQYIKYKSEEASIISKANEISAPKEVSQLDCIKYIYKIFSMPEYKESLINISESKNYLELDLIIKKLNVEKKDVEKLKEIIKHNNFFNDLKNSYNFKSFLQRSIFFKKSIEEIDNLKKNVPHDVNSDSISLFEDWLKKEKDLTSNNNSKENLTK